MGRTLACVTLVGWVMCLCRLCANVSDVSGALTWWHVIIFIVIMKYFYRYPDEKNVECLLLKQK